MPEVVLVTDSGQFALDAMSGGINALFTIAWQIQMFAWSKESCTILIDEPENHLHPSMQRSLLPSLANAFPKYRFIVASHSPFIVASDPEANVFALTHNANRLIESTHLESADLAASPDKVLREVLEVPSTMPIWVETKLQEALREFQGMSADPQAIDTLFAKLKALGLSDSLANLPDSGVN
jgi:AAA domain, putative AbiEii toxin, Type IV TA system